MNCVQIIFFDAPILGAQRSLVYSDTTLSSDSISYYIGIGETKNQGRDEYYYRQKPVAYLKAKTADLLDQINDTCRPVIITQNGEPRAVLQDPKSYEEMRNALGLLKLFTQGEEDISKGNIRGQEEIFTDLERLLREQRS